MQDPREITIEEYDYDLPDDRVAKYPLAERDASKLLVYKGHECQETRFRLLADQLPEGSLLVFNDTRVIHARLSLVLENGSPLEIFCLEPWRPAEYQLNFSSEKSVDWVCLVGGNRKWKSGLAQLKIGEGAEAVTLHLARKERREEGSFIISFSWEQAGRSFGELLATAGLIPLPPYLKRAAEAEDEERYQTIYAREQGSVAAPTAGLHFTEAVFEDLAAKNIRCDYVTLHVGAGTFKPVKSTVLGEHDMHRETILVKRELIALLLDQLKSGQPILAVGTTSLRTLESIYWYGCQCISQGRQAADELSVGQWEPYQPRQEQISAPEALQAALDAMGSQPYLQGQTQILIGPGYQYRLIDGLITNFHQPRSTLLLLVAALIGDDWRKVYAYALAQNFRFLSYGDSSLLWRKT